MKKLIAIIAATLLTGCTQPNYAVELLKQQGYTDIRITGYEFFACSQDDTFHTGFDAKSPSGSRVKGVVCSSAFLKGSTIRFD